MAKYGPASAFLLVGGRNISSDTFRLTESVTEALEQSNGIGKAAEEHLGIGVGAVALEAKDGMYDDAVGAIAEALQAKGTTRQLVCYGFSGHAVGAEVVMLDGLFAAIWNRISQRDGITKADADYKVSVQAYLRGKVLHGITAETADPGSSEGPSLDNGASSAGGLIADLHVPALTLGGFTNFIAKVRHSTDDSTYADLITFAAATALGANERASVGGVINRHLATSWDLTGAGAGQSATFVVAARRG